MAEQLAPAEHIALRDIGAKATVIAAPAILTGMTFVNGLAAIFLRSVVRCPDRQRYARDYQSDWEFPVPASVGALANLSAAGIKFHVGIVVGVTTAEKGAAAVGAGFQGFFFVQ